MSDAPVHDRLDLENSSLLESMASKFFSQAALRRTLIGGTASAGAAAFALDRFGDSYQLDSPFSETKAEVQFLTSYGYSPNGVQLIKPPEGWSGPLFKLKNKYPKPLGDAASAGGIEDGIPLPAPGHGVPTDPLAETPWMKYSFDTQPELYCQAIKEYCYEGNVNNDFRIEKNPVREWYHAPWMHWNNNGREPIHGLTFERSTPPFEFSKTQPTYLQTWACGFYNHAGASAFGQIWADPNQPNWKPFKFPAGTAVFKILMTNATDDEVFTMKNAPAMDAVIAVQPDRTKPIKHPEVRDNKVSKLRLLQMDFAVQDPRSSIGWVFGTFMYDGSQKHDNPWDRIIPVGLQWGNDHWLTPTVYNSLNPPPKPKQSWINPYADELRVALGGQRKYWGFDGRLNGPADNFKSACASCHSTSDWNNSKNPPKLPTMTPPAGADEATIMRWYRDIQPGEPFDEGNVSGDYSLQLQIGMANYENWRNSTAGIFKRTAMKIPATASNNRAAMVEEKRKALRDI